jgi:N-methylhydantoinase A/oxoprolinase/acetone carboxylase beta subunit
MPDVLSFGLGGGSLVREDPLRVGPQSVGYRITEDALVFGGQTLTTTDVAVAAGAADIGDPERVKGLNGTLVAATMARIQEMADGAVDRMKTSAEPIPVIVVGGGSILIARPIAGASEMVKPEHFEAANAVGAAIGQISGEVDRVYSLENRSRADALDDAKGEAMQKAIDAGANLATVQIVDVEDVPLTYLPGNATRVRVKAVGDLTL